MDGAQVFALITLSINLFVIVTHYYDKPQQQHSEQQEEKEEQEQEEKEKAKKVWSWGELDRDLLGEIVRRLCLADQARFRAVCTNWLAAAHLIITNSKSSASLLPWYGCTHPSSEFEIYDPLLSPNHLASRHIIKWSEFGIPTRSSVKLLDVEHNWLFLSIIKDKLYFWTRRWIVLFSPFTKRIITLPKFDYPRGFLFLSAISTQPDSQDCVFCMVDTMHFNKIAILTYRNGDKEWTARQFDRHPDFPPCRVAAQIIRGILYLSCPLGEVATYNILNGEFNYDRLLEDEFIVQNICSKLTRTFVLNDELMKLYFNLDVKDDATLPGQQFIRKYDPLLKVWIPVRTLGDYALFFNRNIIKFSLINTKDRTCKGVLPNKVYRFFDGGCHVYSLKNGRLFQFRSINSNLLEDGGDDLPEYRYNSATPETSRAYWLEAPRLRTSLDNQELRSLEDEGEQGTVRAIG